MAKKVSNTPRLDSRSCADLEDTGSKENRSGENRQDVEANRGRDAAKGIQSGTVTRFPGLILRTSSLP